MTTTGGTMPARPAWWRAALRVGAELWPPRVPAPKPGDSLEQVRLWQADEVSAGTRGFVVLWFGLLLVGLMVVSFVYAPAPGHQLAAAMLWLTAAGVVAVVVAPRLARWAFSRPPVEVEVTDEPEGER